MLGKMSQHQLVHMQGLLAQLKLWAAKIDVPMMAPTPVNGLQEQRDIRLSDFIPVVKD